MKWDTKMEWLGQIFDLWESMPDSHKQKNELIYALTEMLTGKQITELYKTVRTDW